MKRINLDEPRYDQSTYYGRVRHFACITNPLNLLASDAELEQSRLIVENHRRGFPIPLTENELWRAKHLYDSAYHPDTGAKMFWMGRISAAVPLNMCTTGFMLTFQSTKKQIIFWQWMNQSVMAGLNYTNRNAKTEVSNLQLAESYLAATSAAVFTALGLKFVLRRVSPLLSRLAPFVAVAAANCVNVPSMRYQELRRGIPVSTDTGVEVGRSKAAAQTAVTAVLVSRVATAAPAMLLPPIILSRLGGVTQAPKILHMLLQVAMVGALLIVCTPMGCAIFPQKMSVRTSKIEPEIQKTLKNWGLTPDKLYYNRGL